MTIRHTITTAFRSLRANTSRSVLTILGIVIGVTGTILVLSVGQSAQDLILAQVQGIGSRTMFVVPGRDTNEPASVTTLFLDSLKDREVEALSSKANVPTLLDLSPIIFIAGAVTHEGESFTGTSVGVSPVFRTILDLAPSEGVFFDDDDVRRAASVAVIGDEVRKELFGASDAVGETIKIRGRNLRVVGLLPKKGRVGLLNVDDTVIVPYTTARRYLSGNAYYNEIVVRAVDEEAVSRTKRDIEATLRALHGITDPEKDDFHIHTQADIANRVGTITSILTAVLTAIAGIALLVGGIGIMNMMLVSVTERTREIGLRKAVGATDRDILRQFLAEALVLTVSGGLIGIMLGVVLSLVIGFFVGRLAGLSTPFNFPLLPIAVGIVVSLGIGILFGLYPARQAARKSPIEALRYE